MSYAQGWDDCIDVILAAMNESKDLDDLRKKIEYLQGLVKEKKFEKIKADLGIITGSLI